MCAGNVCTHWSPGVYSGYVYILHCSDLTGFKNIHRFLLLLLLLSPYKAKLGKICYCCRYLSYFCTWLFTGFVAEPWPHGERGQRLAHGTHEILPVPVQALFCFPVLWVLWQASAKLLVRGHSAATSQGMATDTSKLSHQKETKYFSVKQKEPMCMMNEVRRQYSTSCATCLECFLLCELGRDHVISWSYGVRDGQPSFHKSSDRRKILLRMECKRKVHNVGNFPSFGDFEGFAVWQKLGQWTQSEDTWARGPVLLGGQVR